MNVGVLLSLNLRIKENKMNMDSNSQIIKKVYALKMLV